MKKKYLHTQICAYGPKFAVCDERNGGLYERTYEYTNGRDNS